MTGSTPVYTGFGGSLTRAPRSRLGCRHVRARSIRGQAAGNRRPVRTASLAVWPRPQIEASRMTWPRSASRASSSLTVPLRLARPPAVPAAPPGGRCRPGTGRTGRRTRRGRTRRCGAGCPGTSVVSSNTTIAPAPSVAPISFACSKVSGMCRSSGPTNTPAAPPRLTALTARPPGTPPASSIRSRSVMPELAPRRRRAGPRGPRR